jgi:predicted anti-sigma-YlaC factor YlaD
VERVLTCRELVEFLDRYLAGELPSEEAARFEHHLALCPACVAWARSYDRTAALARMAFGEGDAAAADVPDELVLAILAATRHPA